MIKDVTATRGRRPLVQVVAIFKSSRESQSGIPKVFDWLNVILNIATLQAYQVHPQLAET